MNEYVNACYFSLAYDYVITAQDRDAAAYMTWNILEQYTRWG
jgi:hypothetical protein